MRKYFVFLLAGFLFFTQNISAQTYSTLLDENFMKHITADELKQLIHDGENPYVTNQSGQTPLHIAAEVNDNPEIIKTLLGYGFNVNIKDSYDGTPLHQAVLYKNHKIVKTLIRYGANVNARDIYGTTPLHYAAGLDLPKITEMLIKYGANVNARNISGETPLHMATYFGSSLINIEILITHGADVNAQNNDGDTALIVAPRNFKLLINRVRKVLQTKTIELQIPKTIELLIKNGANVKIRNKEGKTVLDYYTNDEQLKKQPGYWNTLDLIYNKMNEK